MIFSYNKCCLCPRDVEIYLSAVFFCLAAALPHHNILEDIIKLDKLINKKVDSGALKNLFSPIKYVSKELNVRPV